MRPGRRAGTGSAVTGPSSLELAPGTSSDEDALNEGRPPMTMPETIRYHQLRCAPHLARLRMLAGGPGGAPLRPCAVQQIAEVTDAILGEVTTAGAVLVAGRRNRPSVALLAARLTRLENAARQMITSVQRGDAAA